MLLYYDKFISFFDINLSLWGDSMTVYIDVLFIINVIINYFLLLITSAFSKVERNRVRIFIASVFGGLYCVFGFVLEIGFLQSTVLKILSTLAIALIGFKYISFKQFMRCSIVLFVTFFLFGGIVYGMYFLTNASFMTIKNSSVYIHISPILLVICCVACYLGILIFNYLLKPQQIRETNYSVTVEYRGKCISAPGFMDTGNNLSDIFTDYPVVLCDYETVKALFDSTESPCFEDNVASWSSPRLIKNFRVIPVSTVGGSALLPAFKPDAVLLETNSKAFAIERVLIAVFNNKNYNSQHQIILNPELIINKE